MVADERVQTVKALAFLCCSTKAQICAVYCYVESHRKGMERPRRASLGEPGELHIT